MERDRGGPDILAHFHPRRRLRSTGAGEREPVVKAKGLFHFHQLLLPGLLEKDLHYLEWELQFLTLSEN
jgi:hypothetical protein